MALRSAFAYLASFGARDSGKDLATSSASAFQVSSRVPDSLTATLSASAYLASSRAGDSLMATLPAFACLASLRAGWAKAKVSAYLLFLSEFAGRD